MISDIKNPDPTYTSSPIQFWRYFADVKNISNMYPYGKSYGTNAVYNAAEDYRYGFNGMEKEKNMDASGDITDFGARVFDANFPTFLSRDPLEKEMPWYSSYHFVGANPIKYYDFQGGIKLSEEDKRLYPKLDNLLQFIGNKLSENDELVKTLVKWSASDEETVKAALEYGNGPLIKISKLGSFSYNGDIDGDNLSFGFYNSDYPDQIKLNSSLISIFETLNYDNENIELINFLVVVTTIHETLHYIDYIFDSKSKNSLSLISFDELRNMHPDRYGTGQQWEKEYLGTYMPSVKNNIFESVSVQFNYKETNKNLVPEIKNGVSITQATPVYQDYSKTIRKKDEN